jgi:hypothetical protein
MLVDEFETVGGPTVRDEAAFTRGSGLDHLVHTQEG